MGIDNLDRFLPRRVQFSRIALDVSTLPLKRTAPMLHVRWYIREYIRPSNSIARVALSELRKCVENTKRKLSSVSKRRISDGHTARLKKKTKTKTGESRNRHERCSAASEVMRIANLGCSHSCAKRAFKMGTIWVHSCLSHRDRRFFKNSKFTKFRN